MIRRINALGEAAVADDSSKSRESDLFLGSSPVHVETSETGVWDSAEGAACLYSGVGESDGSTDVAVFVFSGARTTRRKVDPI